MKFRDLKTGDYFKFDNGVSTFNEVCRKMSARRYGWSDADGKTQMSSVGTIYRGREYASMQLINLRAVA